MFYQRFINPILFSFDEEAIHNFVMGGLRIAGKLHGGALVRSLCEVEEAALAVDFAGLHFKNPVGLAAGFDKYVKAGEMWGNLGFGHVEFGSVTLEPQNGNPGKRLWRIPAHQSIQNYFGLNNAGAENFASKLQHLKAKNYVKGVSIAKNTNTSMTEIENFAACFEKVVDVADYITFNLSCPNVKDKRGLLNDEFVHELLSVVTDREKKMKVKKPVFIKIPSLLDTDQLKGIVKMAEKHDIAGIVATNTKADFTEKELGFKLPGQGGVSGQVLQKYALHTVHQLYQMMDKKMVIIGVGGIFNAEDAVAMLRAGASLLQVYTGFIYEGPLMVRKISKGLLQYMKQHGVKNYQELIGKK